MPSADGDSPLIHAVDAAPHRYGGSVHQRALGRFAHRNSQLFGEPYHIADLTVQGNRVVHHHQINGDEVQSFFQGNQMVEDSPLFHPNALSVNQNPAEPLQALPGDDPLILPGVYQLFASFNMKGEALLQHRYPNTGGGPAFPGITDAHHHVSIRAGFEDAVQGMSDDAPVNRYGDAVDRGRYDIAEGPGRQKVRTAGVSGYNVAVPGMQNGHGRRTAPGRQASDDNLRRSTGSAREANRREPGDAPVQQCIR